MSKIFGSKNFENFLRKTACNSSGVGEHIHSIRNAEMVSIYLVHRLLCSMKNPIYRVPG